MKSEISSKRLEGRPAIVVGAGSSGPGWGNGKAAAYLYAHQEAMVIAADTRLERAQKTSALTAENGPTCIALQADVTVEKDVKAVVDATLKRFGRIDVLHNNAGVARMVATPVRRFSVHPTSRSSSLVPVSPSTGEELHVRLTAEAASRQRRPPLFDCSRITSVAPKSLTPPEICGFALAACIPFSSTQVP